jgi:hypothetical protein
MIELEKKKMDGFLTEFQFKVKKEELVKQRI